MIRDQWRFPTYLAAQGSAVVPPATELPAGPHSDGWDLACLVADRGESTEAPAAYGYEATSGGSLHSWPLGASNWRPGRR